MQVMHGPMVHNINSNLCRQQQSARRTMEAASGALLLCCANLICALIVGYHVAAADVHSPF